MGFADRFSDILFLVWFRVVSIPSRQGDVAVDFRMFKDSMGTDDMVNLPSGSPEILDQLTDFPRHRVIVYCSGVLAKRWIVAAKEDLHVASVSTTETIAATRDCSPIKSTQRFESPDF
jgi:hypothetical protein